LNFARTLRARSPLAGVLMLGTALGCGGLAEGEGGESVRADSESLKIDWAGVEPVYWSGADSQGTASGATGTPALASHCVASFVAFTRASGNRYRGAAAGELGPSSWNEYDTRSFASSPSLTGLPSTDNCSSMRFLVAGRGSGTGANSRIYFSLGRATQSAGVYGPLTRTTNFAQVSTQEFSGSNGYPAVSSSTTGAAFLVYRNGSTIYGHYKAAGATTWTNNPHQAPALPSPWVPIGTPAIEYGWNNLAFVIIRAQSGTAIQFFRIFYNNNGFQIPFGGTPYWLGLPLPSGSAAIQSDPAVEWNDELFTHTVYYRSGTSFYQASIFVDGWEEVPKQVLHPFTTPSYNDAPAVNGNVDYEQTRRHWLLGRSGNELWFSVINETDSNLLP
jgi:hypothetical protein